MKQHRNRRKTRRRHSRFRASNWFPFVMLFLAVFTVLGLASLIVFVGLPKLMPLIGLEYRAPFAPPPTPTPTAPPTPTPNPMDSFNPVDAQSEVIFTGSTGYTWFGDPYFYKGTLLLSAGKVVDNSAVMTSLFFYYPDKDRTAEPLPYTLKNKHFMFARFNDRWIVYLDAKLDGGGNVTVVDRGEPGAKPFIIKEVYAGQPELMLDGNYLAWIERTGSKMDKLFLCNLTTRETVTVEMFNNNIYGQSTPSLRSGVLTWASLDSALGSADTTSTICSIMLSGSTSTKTYRPGTFVHDPESDGVYTAWLDGNHGPETNLYYCKNNGAAALLDRGVLDFGLGDGFIAYAKDSAIYAYRFADNKSYRITPERESVQFLGVSDGKVLWMDVTTRERDIVKFAPIP